MSFNQNPWKVLSSTEVYDNPWIGVTEYAVINPAGGHGIYGKVHFKNLAIGIVVLDEQLHTCLVGQHRFPLDEYSWEIPEGGCPVGMDPLEGAQRELLEETGLLAHSWEKVMDMHLSNSVSDEHAIVYLAWNVEQKTPAPEETELLELKRLPFEEAYEMVEAGEITDAISVAAILKVKLMLNDGRIS